MRIVNTQQESKEAGIELADLESVKEAIRIFAGGATAGSRNALSHGFDDTPNGGIGLMMKMMVDVGHEDAFLQRLLAKVDRVEENGYFSDDWDYDGPGPFFKNTLRLEKWQVSGKDVYTLHFNAAYVGDQPTAGLAQSLGADRALWRDEVTIEVAPFGEKMFDFDFDVVADRLKSIGLDSLTGQDMAKYIIEHAESQDYVERNTPLRVRDDDLVVHFGIASYSVGDVRDRETGKMLWHWRRPTATITGPLARWETDNNPRMWFSVSVPRDENESSWNRQPIFDPKVKQAVHDQTAALVGAFS